MIPNKFPHKKPDVFGNVAKSRHYDWSSRASISAVSTGAVPRKIFPINNHKIFALLFRLGDELELLDAPGSGNIVAGG